MSLSPIFQRDPFGTDAGLSGWPSDGLDDPAPAPQTVAGPRASSASALRIALDLVPSRRQPDLPGATTPSRPEGAAPAE